MTEKQQNAVKKIIADLPPDYQGIYREIAEHAISLGYLPSLKGAQGQYVIFNKNFPKCKTNRTILKIVADHKQKNYSMETRFFANKSYSPFFEKAIDLRLSYNFDTDHGCSNCGKCDGTQGYYYKTSDGERKFICGFVSLIQLPLVQAENISEIKDALTRQDDLYVRLYG